MGIRNWFKKNGNKAENDAVLEIDWTPIASKEIDFLFIKVSDEDILKALEAWKWFPLKGLTVVAVSAFGEVFFGTRLVKFFTWIP